jgi:AcrR family transcriptional regulator
MPRPRFARLPQARRTALLEAAAQQFGTHGFEDASLNQILEHAGISKGAAYYYFDDKEDLFLTVVRHYMAELNLGEYFVGLADNATAENFWSSLAEVYRRAFVNSHDLPWAFGVWRAASDMLRAKPGGPLADFANEWLAIALELFKRGQVLGVIRSDLPDDLLLSWARAVDDAHDRWVLAHWDELDANALSAAADRMVDGLRRLIGCAGGDA